MFELVVAVEAVSAAVAVRRKRRAVSKLEGRMAAAARKLFQAQERALLKRLPRIKPLLAGRVAEAATDDDVDAIWEQLELETTPAFATAWEAVVTDAMLAGARALAAELSIQAAFNAEHPRALSYLQREGAARVRGINETTRTEVKRVIAQSFEAGKSYSAIAADLRTTMRAMRIPDRKPRQRHIRDRAELIAITEVGEAYEHANQAVAEEVQAAGLELEKQWLTVGDSRVSDGCRENQAVGWIDVEAAFPSGHQRPLRFPGCLPGWTRVAPNAVLGVTKRFFDGELVVITTASGNELACTPNHPILTMGGWIAAGVLDVGGNVISQRNADWPRSTYMHEPNVPPTIEQVAEAFRRSRNVSADVVKVTAPHFHGDGAGSEIAVVWSERELSNGRDSAFTQQCRQLPLMLRNIRRVGLARLGHFATLSPRMLATCGSAMRGSRVTSMFFRRAVRHHQLIGAGGAANLNASLFETGFNNASAYPVMSCQGILRFACFVAFRHLVNGNGDAISGHGGGAVVPWDDAVAAEMHVDGLGMYAELAREIRSGATGTVFTDEIVSVKRHRFAGHVFNLQTETGFYVAEGIITHNCRCTALHRRRQEERS